MQLFDAIVDHSVILEVLRLGEEVTLVEVLLRHVHRLRHAGVVEDLSIVDTVGQFVTLFGFPARHHIGLLLG